MSENGMDKKSVRDVIMDKQLAACGIDCNK